jgi:enoyl-CoA hydratase/carnithine racemase
VESTERESRANADAAPPRRGNGDGRIDDAHGPELVVERRALADEQSLALVRLNRPETMNAVDWELGRALAETFEQLAEDPAVRVVAVTGSGNSFSAGGDMERYRTLQRDPERFPVFLREMQAMLARIGTYPKPFLALVNGVAVAGGFELILACDIVFAARSARMGDAHLNFGQMGGGGVLTMLTRAVGPNRARELVLSGRMLDAEEAREWGLVSRVVADDQLIDASVAFAREVSAKSPLGVANAKRVLNQSLWHGTGMQVGFELELEAVLRYCLTSNDAPEGLEAFAAKRRPAFTGT